jgi:hypothetical protein
MQEHTNPTTVDLLLLPNEEYYPWNPVLKSDWVHFKEEGYLQNSLYSDSHLWV